MAGCSRNSWHSRRQDCSIMRGNRRITTLRKLPTINPNRVQESVKMMGSESAISMAWAIRIVAQITEPSIKIGRYMAIISPPIRTPSIDIIMGSRRELKLSTALSTAAS